MRVRSLLAASSLASLLAASSAAFAQGEATPAPAPAPTPPPPTEAPVAPATATTTTTATATVASPAPAATHADDGDTDFSKIVKAIGIGYFGQYDVPLGVAGAGSSGVATQIIGVRYFFNERMGIDVGWGIGLSSGSTKVTRAGVTESRDTPSTLAMSFKAGVPIVAFSGKHYSFFFEPQALFGFAGQTVKPTTAGTPPPPDTKHNGSRITVGGAAGALVQFGFIGIPQLSLDATVGLGFDIRNAKTEAPDGGGPNVVTTSVSSTGFGSLAGHQPWNIFHTNVAAIYYF